MIFRTLLAFVIAPATANTPHPIAEVGAYVYSRLPTRSAKDLLTKDVEGAYDIIAGMRNWGFPANGEVHAENSARLDDDEKPANIPFGEIQRYVYWYDRHGNIKGGFTNRDQARKYTKYGEDFFKGNV